MLPGAGIKRIHIPIGVSSGSSRILRGGSWNYRCGGFRHEADGSRLTARGHDFPWEKYTIGFRVVRHPQVQE